MPDVTWTDRVGGQHTTTVSITDGAADKPVVVLLHGFKGNLNHMKTPGVSPGFNFNYAAPFPPPRDLGRKWRPGIGIYLIEPDPEKTVVGWEPFLQQQGFATVNFGQINPVGTVGLAALELAAVVAYLRRNPPTNTKKIAFLAHSRGGLLVRKFLKDNAADTLLAGQITKVITLGSPHFGTELANLALAFRTALERVLSAVPPPFRVMVRARLQGIIELVSSPAYYELRVGSPFLAELAANEAPFPGAEYYAFAGTSPLFTRIRAWMYTPASAFPTWWGGPPYHHRIRMIEFPLISPLFTKIPLAPELTAGAGDILAATPRTYFPFPGTPHYRVPCNHAELLWPDQGLKDAVLRILQAAPPRQLRVSVSPYPAPLNTTAPIQLTVNAVDAQSNALVAATVHLDNYLRGGESSSEAFAANSPHAVTLRTRTAREDLLMPSGYVRASSYRDVAIDFGF